MTEQEPGSARVRRRLPRMAERIGPYLLLGRLGAGSMGQVYLGRSPAGRLVAVKTIRAELAEEEGFRARFAQEVAAARRVSGFFTAAVVEADPDADLPWLATAYVPAPSLSRLVRACGPLPVAAVRWLAAGGAEALDSIHRAGLVHRDLKPSNVLVAPDGPRVIDFGVARAAERLGTTTAAGTVGTPAYMAPEQARDTGRASAASDVYSLGATLAFAATGHPPYGGDNVLDVLTRLATEEPGLSDVPPELGPLLAACMHRDPAQRPTSAAILAQLGQFTEGDQGPATEHSYLPEQAMALIVQYQHNPLLAAQPSGSADGDESYGSYGTDEDTAASLTELPAAYQPPSKSRRQRSVARRGRLRSPLAAVGWALVGWVSAGAALVMGGVVLGVALSGSRAPLPASQARSSQPQSSALLQPQPPPVAGPPPAPATVCGSTQGSSSPALCMVTQSLGTPSTTFSIQGRHFAPGATVTFSLSEIGPPPADTTLVHMTSRYHPMVTPGGTFTVLVSQLYSASLQLGQFTVDASVAGGTPVSTQFIVIPAGASAGPSTSG